MIHRIWPRRFRHRLDASALSVRFIVSGVSGPPYPSRGDVELILGFRFRPSPCHGFSRLPLYGDRSLLRIPWRIRRAGSLYLNPSRRQAARHHLSCFLHSPPFCFG